MNEIHIQQIAGELKVQPRQVLATAKLFAEGATGKTAAGRLVHGGVE